MMWSWFEHDASWLDHGWCVVGSIASKLPPPQQPLVLLKQTSPATMQKTRVLVDKAVPLSALMACLERWFDMRGCRDLRQLTEDTSRE